MNTGSTEQVVQAGRHKVRGYCSTRVEWHALPQSGAIVKHDTGELGDGGSDKPPSGRVISQACFEDNSGAGFAKHFDVKILAADSQYLVAACSHCRRQESENSPQ